MINRVMPPKIHSLVYTYDVWILGSSAYTFETEELAKGYHPDIDIMVPFSLWREAALHVPGDAVPNSFGGWKWTSNGVFVDMWPDELSRLVVMSAFKIAWHPLSNKRITVVNS